MASSIDHETGRSKVTVRNRPETTGDWVGLVCLVMGAMFLLFLAGTVSSEQSNTPLAFGMVCAAAFLGVCAVAHYRFLHRTWRFDVGPDEVTVSIKKWGRPQEVSVSLRPADNRVKVVTRRVKARTSGASESRTVQGGYSEHRLRCNGKELLATNQIETAHLAVDAVKAAVVRHRPIVDSD